VWQPVERILDGQYGVFGNLQGIIDLAIALWGFRLTTE
jgi:hypothetical protein